MSTVTLIVYLKTLEKPLDTGSGRCGKDNVNDGILKRAIINEMHLCQ
jgi:hypothetical protein